MIRNFFLILALLTSMNGVAQRVYWAEKVVDFSSQLSAYEYSAEQVLGKPNSLPQAGDSPSAWLPSKANRIEFVRVTFEKEIRVQQIAIAESYNPSAVYEIYLYDRVGNEHLVHSFNPRPIDVKGRLLNIFIDKTNFKVYGLKLVIDGSAVPGYSGIDAIGVSGSQKPIIIEIEEPENIKEEILTEALGSEVNSTYSETRPLIAPDGKTLYFSRKNHPENLGGEDDGNDIWYSELDEETGEWKEAKNIGRPLNTKEENFISSITPDGKAMTVLLGNEYTRRDKMKPGVSISRKTSEGWEKPEPLDIINAYIEGTDGNYFLASNMRTLIMAVDRYDSYGGKDLYVSFLQGDGKWTEPLNLGNDINTANSETSPFLAADNETLYFSSGGFAGYGGSDVYISRRLDDTWTNWTEPENLGPDINSENDDVFFTIPPSGSYAYFSKGTRNNTDIHRIEMPIFYQPSPIVSMMGNVVDAETGQPIAAKISYRLQPEDLDVGFTLSDSVTGDYDILLPAGAAYTFKIEADGYLLAEGSIDLMEETDYREIGRNITLSKVSGTTITETDIVATTKDDKEAKSNAENDAQVEEFVAGTNDKIVLTDYILFDFASDYLKAEAKPYLDKIIVYLKEKKDIKLQIDGHTDNIGPSQYNISLSERRAKSVLKYFTENGLSKGRFETKGYGFSKPLESNDTPDGRSKNRRVEFSIIK